jgi:glutamate-1-semialdehyde 2,1-aminomutase
MRASGCRLERGGSRSEELFARARRVSPGGVHSPVRAFRGVGGTPRFMTGGAGAMPARCRRPRVPRLLHGLRAPDPGSRRRRQVRLAAEAALARGWSLGTAEPYSLELAELITARVPWVESIRFVNSGTEAVMSALRVARAATGRSKILKFEGCYHGHTDSMLLRAGSGLAEAPLPDSAGLAPDVVQQTLIAPLDDEAALEAMLTRHGARSPRSSSSRCRPTTACCRSGRSSCRHIARLARAHGALLIFDEVISGFRLSFQGYAGVSGIHPDLTTYGKVIGGGFPGRRLRRPPRADGTGGTGRPGLPGRHPERQSAGDVRRTGDLQRLADGRLYQRLEELGARLQRALSGVPGLAIQRVGSVFWICSSAAPFATPMRTPQSLPADAGASFAPLFHRCSNAGSIWRRAPSKSAFCPRRTPRRTSIRWRRHCSRCCPATDRR